MIVKENIVLSLTLAVISLCCWLLYAFRQWRNHHEANVAEFRKMIDLIVGMMQAQDKEIADLRSEIGEKNANK